MTSSSTSFAPRSRGRLANTFLFVGPEGVGKRTFALELARGVLCLTNGPTSVDACGGCESCRLYAVGNHPDLHFVAKPKDKSRVTLEQLLGDDEHRMRAGLCYEMSLRPYLGNRKIAIIDDADTLDAGQGESANSLLKILEQPPGNGIFILLSTDINRQLPTIRSRSQLVRFNALDEADVAAILVENKLSTDADETARLAALSDGSVATALANADFDCADVSRRSSKPWPSVRCRTWRLLRRGRARRRRRQRRRRCAGRLKRLMGTAAEFYRELARGLTDAPARRRRRRSRGDAACAEFARLGSRRRVDGRRRVSGSDRRRRPQRQPSAGDRSLARQTRPHPLAARCGLTSGPQRGSKAYKYGIGHKKNKKDKSQRQKSYQSVSRIAERPIWNASHASRLKRDHKTLVSILDNEHTPIVDHLPFLSFLVFLAAIPHSFLHFLELL
ncbi:MAG: DNA polymerase III subunit [Pirellulales bacterium]